MKRLFPLLFLLCACAPFQKAGTDKNGQPYITQSGGVWSKTKGVIQKADNGSLHLEQMVEDQDGVVGPQGVVDGAVSAVASWGYFKRDVNDSNNTASVSKHKTTADTKVKLKQLDNEGKAIEGENAVNLKKAGP